MPTCTCTRRDNLYIDRSGQSWVIDPCEIPPFPPSAPPATSPSRREQLSVKNNTDATTLERLGLEKPSRRVHFDDHPDMHRKASCGVENHRIPVTSHGSRAHLQQSAIEVVQCEQAVGKCLDHIYRPAGSPGGNHLDNATVTSATGCGCCAKETLHFHEQTATGRVFPHPRDGRDCISRSMFQQNSSFVLPVRDQVEYIPDTNSEASTLSMLSTCPSSLVSTSVLSSSLSGVSHSKCPPPSSRRRTGVVDTASTRERYASQSFERTTRRSDPRVRSTCRPVQKDSSNTTKADTRSRGESDGASKRKRTSRWLRCMGWNG